jgi:hypothetical protein
LLIHLAPRRSFWCRASISRSSIDATQTPIGRQREFTETDRPTRSSPTMRYVMFIKRTERVMTNRHAAEDHQNEDRREQDRKAGVSSGTA